MAKIVFPWVSVGSRKRTIRKSETPAEPKCAEEEEKEEKKPTNIDYIQKLRITFVLISRVVDSDGEKLEWRKTAGGTRSCMKNSGRDNKRTKESEKDEQKNHVPSMPCKRFLSVG